MTADYATLRSTFFLAVGVALLLQTPAETAFAADGSPADLSAAAAQTGAMPATESADSLAEIIVTANKRNESVQKAPAAITALGGDALAELGIESAVDLTKVVPGAEIVEAPAVSQAFIRGVGSNIDNPYVDPGVAINVNGISTPRYATSAGFLDVARVEVLPGPQGTLYGGSAAGGVVNVIAVQPSHNFDGEGIIEAGNYGMAHAFIAQNFAVGDGAWAPATPKVCRPPAKTGRRYGASRIDSTERHAPLRIAGNFCHRFLQYSLGNAAPLERLS
jgi:iron complex outermembrane receptor protein